jgi:hypothetical protein
MDCTPNSITIKKGNFKKQLNTKSRITAVFTVVFVR